MQAAVSYLTPQNAIMLAYIIYESFDNLRMLMRTFSRHNSYNLEILIDLLYFPR
jgi:hypothetical protein